MLALSAPPTAVAPTASELDLLRAALLEDERAIAAWNRWRARADRLDTAIRLLPLAEWNLRRISGCGSLTGRTPDPLQATWIENQRTIAGARPALEALAGRGIRPIVFKGLDLARTVYPGLATRRIGDVDLLLAREELDAALRALQALGWRETDRRAPSARPHLHGFELERGGVAVDLHGCALYECRGVAADRGLWSRSRPFTVEGVEVAALAACDHLLVVCVHGQRWSRIPAIHWIADAALLIRRAQGGIDWDALLQEAEERSLQLPLAAALRLLCTEVEAGVPDHVVARLDSARCPRWQRLETRWRGRAPSLVGGLFLHWCDWRRMHPTRTAARCLLGFPRFLCELWGVEGWLELPRVVASKLRARTGAGDPLVPG